jgi:hypothetical protein
MKATLAVAFLTVFMTGPVAQGQEPSQSRWISAEKPPSCSPSTAAATHRA